MHLSRLLWNAGIAMLTHGRNFRLLSRDRKSSEQFTGPNRRYDEMKAEFALVPSKMSDTSQEEAI